MARLEPLTAQERDFAAEHHNIVYKFLYVNKFSIDDFYDIAALGYLQGVRAYLNREKSKTNIPFTVVAWGYMRAAVQQYFNKQDAAKRIPPELILSLDIMDEDKVFFNHIYEDQYMENVAIEKQVLETVVKAFTQMQQAIIWCKLDGMNNREICKELGILDGKFYREFNKIKAAAERIIERRSA